MADHQSKFAFVVVAAGRGERMGASQEGPKQYRKIAGKPVIRLSLEQILTWPHCAPVVVVIHPDDTELCDKALAGLNADPRFKTVFGGKTRQESVLKGLKALETSGIDNVMIHDAVRPFIDHALLDRVAQPIVEGSPGAIPAIAVADTLKRADASIITETIDRQALFAAQTPQAFHFATILNAHEQASKAADTGFTDDASILEWAGIPVRLAEGTADNIKITLRRDLEIANERMSKRMVPDVRCGNGYDVHQLVDGDGVTLCGVFIEHEKRLSGHSDADVALHALTDALLATCGAGDIGDHFPPSDPQWKGCASHVFLRHAANIVRERGGRITNADISIIAERPKIGPRRDEMRKNLAEMLEIDLERCSVKATTNEKIGFAGREEGIAAIATATVIYGAHGHE
ncbi:bifunctional 2-C-methyl-D-erythritol 4-phosphate cytidylyltransferase/2-C-methyl-D-erythritol 2,4-cyclodiphosphate synthase [Rhizobium sp. L1K21]|uniref:bifunctional 2-C-methyl-D-erythritol 4-phosphate cytidylyltransferase/2-C-methyl-D-erythritol 2,4-cyclodiphosphate synthase n=1 Tax=Rhizobium sp. L1K21 TaxID=2954933 RepID=UPI0020927883|nr:bifunctional 2-C-methyl-D-erythritol 4-phosphate cytidylyltransferase/2-C-methyl-D-erythritol 2,4-cyclodiphosphate synthase [Rhizobium sp. L1K21]MCO6185936.1 bifunctional 2-C-methyl-D-erythritol 4-phosphate cytidylyltransferase/2-C-methyl-D-erythritol 2,4-cyclodiphosphate synthase [Rhizobium sp. L1K21]